MRSSRLSFPIAPSTFSQGFSTQASTSIPTVPPNLDLFEAQIRDEFINGSAIAPALFEAAVQVVPDLIMQAGGEVETPIHNAFNWKYTRFSQQAKATLLAALLVNEDGTTWQGKLNHPHWDAKKGKARKYETPVGNGSRTYLPEVPLSIRRKIAQRYGILDPRFVPNRSARRHGISMAPFWEWIEQHPNIPLVPTEGGKKGLALLSQGYVPLALYGVSGGYYAKDALGHPVSPYLTPDVARFAVAGRKLLLAFDQDAADATRRKVSVALSRFGRLLSAATGIEPLVVTWNSQAGKGVDDLIVNQGVEAWSVAMAKAMPLDHWQIWQRLDNRLTYTTHLHLNSHDLSTLDLARLPEEGILAIASAKGTGKTKFIAQTVKSTGQVLGAGHRVALMRNLCERLRLDYRGDLDRVQGQFINQAGYSLRIGFCVDSLLAIDPQKFQGCDLIIDELVQVLRHLITSSTCAKEGKRPVLLARFKELVRVARRVIVADADLDNASLRYLQELRGQANQLFLIRNDYQPQSYPVSFLDCPNHSIIMARLLAEVGQVPCGQVVLAATDSKRTSKVLARQIQKQYPDRRILLINSETSGCEAEREFIETPDAVLSRREYDVIVVSPSMATGVSIESQGAIAKVYGIFNGVSSTDADMAQALDRVREPVPRVVWCAEHGRNYSPVSRSINPIELKRHLQEQTSATVQLVRSNLNAAALESIAQYDWQADPHVNLWAQIGAEQNRSMSHLRTALLVRLRFEGKQVNVEVAQSNAVIQEKLKATRSEITQLDAEALMTAAILDSSEVLQLEQKEVLSPEDSRAIARYYFCDFYGIDSSALTLEMIMEDKNGRRRGELLNLEAQLFPGLAADRTAKALERQALWNQGLCPWDISKAELRRLLREKLRLNDFLDPNKEWTEDDLEAYAAAARQHSVTIKQLCHFTISNALREDGKPKISDTQIIHQLLSQMGVKVKLYWRGSGKNKHRVYRLDGDRWQQLITTLNQRQLRRQTDSQKDFEPLEGSPEQDFKNPDITGDPTVSSNPALQQWLTPEGLEDVKQMMQMADSVEAREWLQQTIPQWVLQQIDCSRGKGLS
ncbi:MAG: DUF3854 domain-containing protein [Leptolyngbyaceae cyanobacterium CSU_1_4]|nr:DUF3854 domain-containing protein [Leptolyngbyaceae cyanobacterium CSU_1_4]